MDGERDKVLMGYRLCNEGATLGRTSHMRGLYFCCKNDISKFILLEKLAGCLVA